MRNLGLDLLKIFSCIGVVILHSTRPGFNLEHYNISAYLYYLATYAIPLFFMLNGYFLLNKKKLPYSYVFNKRLIDKFCWWIKFNTKLSL